MALHIMKDSGFLQKLPNRYQEYATVERLRKTGLKKFFGPRAGTVTVSLPQGPAYPVFRVSVPKWKGGQGREWETLRQCYQKALQMADARHCEAIAIPLLAAEDPAFPPNIDYKIAVDIIRDFSQTHELDVFLMVFRQNAVPRPRLLRDVEQYLSRHNPEWTLHQYSESYTDSGDFFNISESPLMSSVDFSEPNFSSEKTWDGYSAPPSMPLASCGQAPSPQECYRELSYKEAPEEAPARKKVCHSERPAPPKKSVARKSPSRTAKISDRSSERSPDVRQLSWMLKHMDAGFSETLLQLIDKTGKKDSEIYNKANVSRQHFSKIRNNPDYKPTKPTAIAFAIALELDLAQTEDLIRRAGYALTNSSTFDVIIMYFIQNRNYNMFDINEMLYEFDQSLLGA